jgi:hypothetical protein
MFLQWPVQLGLETKFQKLIPLLPVHRLVHVHGYPHEMDPHHDYTVSKFLSISQRLPGTNCMSFSPSMKAKLSERIMYAPIGLDSINSQTKWMAYISAVKAPWMSVGGVALLHAGHKTGLMCTTVLSLMSQSIIFVLDLGSQTKQYLCCMYLV